MPHTALRADASFTRGAQLALVTMAQMKARSAAECCARGACGSSLRVAPRAQSNLLSMYFAHRDWDWATKEAPAGGRAKLQAGHVDQVRAVLLELNEAQCELLVTPNVGRSRHFFTQAGAAARWLACAACACSRLTPALAGTGRHKRAKVQAAKAVLLQRIAAALNRMSAAVEEMKTGARSDARALLSSQLLSLNTASSPRHLTPRFHRNSRPAWQRGCASAAVQLAAAGPVGDSS